MTRLLLHSSVWYVEFVVMFVVGCGLASKTGCTWRWMGCFTVWVTLDFLSHEFVASNGPSALYMGRHYLGWALFGQAKLAFQEACVLVGY